MQSRYSLEYLANFWYIDIGIEHLLNDKIFNINILKYDKYDLSYKVSLCSYGHSKPIWRVLYMCIFEFKSFHCGNYFYGV